MGKLSNIRHEIFEALDKIYKQKQKELKKIESIKPHVLIDGDPCESEDEINELYGFDMISEKVRDKKIEELRKKQENCKGKEIEEEMHYISKVYSVIFYDLMPEDEKEKLMLMDLERKDDIQ